MIQYFRVLPEEIKYFCINNTEVPNVTYRWWLFEKITIVESTSIIKLKFEDATLFTICLAVITS